MNNRNEILDDFLREIELAKTSEERQNLIDLIYLSGVRSGFKKAQDLSNEKLRNVAWNSLENIESSRHLSEGLSWHINCHGINTMLLDNTLWILIHRDADNRFFSKQFSIIILNLKQLGLP